MYLKLVRTTRYGEKAFNQTKERILNLNNLFTLLESRNAATNFVTGRVSIENDMLKSIKINRKINCKKRFVPKYLSYFLWFEIYCVK